MRTRAIPGLLQAVRSDRPAMEGLAGRTQMPCSPVGMSATGSAWLRHQLQELDAETLEPEALAELDASHRRQAHAASLIAACEHALEQLGGDHCRRARNCITCAAACSAR
jgi:hypothetical protein